MARWTSFLGSSKAVSAVGAGAATTTISFSGNDLPSAGVIAYHFVMTANQFSLLNRIRVKADARQIYDVSRTHFRKWVERFSQNGLATPDAYTRFTVPFNLMDIVDDDLADICQFPRGTVPTVELVFGGQILGTNVGPVVAGNVFAGWTQTDAAPQFFPQLVGQVMNIPASSTNATYSINTMGAIRGAVVDTTGLSRLKLELNGFSYHQLTGALYQGVATGDMTLASQDLEDGANSSGGVTITSQAGLRIPMIAASGGGSRVELDTGTTWSTGCELTTWSINNQN